MRAWFERYPEILKQETAALEPLGFTLDELVLKQHRVVVFRGRSNVDGERVLRLEYPSGYPSFPPRMYQEPGPRLLSRHQHPQTLEFCLFGPAASEYSSAVAWGPTAIAQTEELIRDYPPGSQPVGTEVAEPVSALMPFSSMCGGFLVPPAIAGISLPLPGANPHIGECTLHCRIDGERSQPKLVRGFVAGAKITGKVYPSAPPYQAFPGGKPLPARLILLGETPPVCTREDRFRGWLQLADLNPDKVFCSHWLVFGYPEESGTSQQTGTAWTVLHVDRTTTDCYRAFALRDDERFARVPGYERLATKKVVLVGVGSIGSRIATILAASGVRNLLLIDRDVFEPANTVRHELGISSFGLWKSEAMLQRLFEANPGCVGNVRAGHGVLGATVPDADEPFLKEIADCDLVVNATGSDHASHWLNMLCLENEKPCIHASVTDGATAGEVITVIPRQSACWICQQLAVPMPPAAAGGRTLYAPGCAQPTFTGSMAEVGIVADLAATTCIDTLLGRRNAASGSHIRWQSRDARGAFCPSVAVSSPAPRQQCPFCGPVR